jgi:hypothetical protein
MDDLISVLLRGPAGASQAAAAPVLERPADTLVYGSRTTSLYGNAALAYTASPRLRLDFAAGAGRMAYLSGGGTQTSDYLVSGANSKTASADVSYALTPRTGIGVAVRTARRSSRQFDSLANGAAMSVQRRAGLRWLVEGHAGAAVLQPVRGFQMAAKTGLIGGGSVAYRGFSRGVRVSAARNLGDSYALGGSAEDDALAAFSWRRPASPWMLTGAVGWQRLTLESGARAESRRAVAGLRRSLGGSVGILIEGAYAVYRGSWTREPGRASQLGVRFSIVWMPEDRWRSGD